MSDLEKLCDRLIEAASLLKASYDHRLWLAVQHGRRVVLAELTPVPWWRRWYMYVPMPAVRQFAVLLALRRLDVELERCRPPLWHRRSVREQQRRQEERERYVPPPPPPPSPPQPASPCLQSERCENCGSRSRLTAVTQDCTLDVSRGLRIACATLCEKCMNTPLTGIFGAAEIAVRIRRHAEH